MEYYRFGPIQVTVSRGSLALTFWIKLYRPVLGVVPICMGIYRKTDSGFSLGIEWPD